MARASAILTSASNKSLRIRHARQLGEIRPMLADDRCGSRREELEVSTTSPVILHLPTFGRTSVFVVQGQKLTHAPHRKAQLFVGLPTSANEGYPKKAHSRVLLGDDEMSLRTPARSRFVCEPNHQRQSDEDAERVA